MADVRTVDIDGSQWSMKDQEARNEIVTLKNKLSEIIDTTFDGTATFKAYMKYLGENNNYIYYNFWWEPQSVSIQSPLDGLVIYPYDKSNDKIINLNINVLQSGNSSIIQKTQHPIGYNDCGMFTYLQGVNSVPNWVISGMGILRRNK